MELRYHGGKCCGIKTITNFSMLPDATVRAKKAEEFLGLDLIGSGGLGKTCFYAEAPEETYLERFDRILEYVKKWRPQGMVEVVLASNIISAGNDYRSQKKQLDVWGPIFLDRGFKEVAVFKNSNTGNIIHVYHLIYDMKTKKAEPEISLRAAAQPVEETAA